MKYPSKRKSKDAATPYVVAKYSPIETKTIRVEVKYVKPGTKRKSKSYREKVRLLQEAVLIKLHKQDRLAQLPQGPIDFTAWLSGKEALRILRRARKNAAA